MHLPEKLQFENNIFLVSYGLLNEVIWASPYTFFKIMTKLSKIVHYSVPERKRKYIFFSFSIGEIDCKLAVPIAKGRSENGHTLLVIIMHLHVEADTIMSESYHLLVAVQRLFYFL